MKKEDLKVGYLLDFGKEGMAMVMPFDDDELCISGKSVWFPLHELDDELRYESSEVDAVYGITTPRQATLFETENRELLWERGDKVAMTIEEIEEELGHKIRVVEKKNDCGSEDSFERAMAALFGGRMPF